jgi:hypothetical protein
MKTWAAIALIAGLICGLEWQTLLIDAAQGVTVTWPKGPSGPD